MNIALETYVGSTAHNLMQQDSDEDIMAVAFPSLKQLVGLEQFGQSGTIEDRNPGKEKVTYDIRKAFTMWRNMNPNAIEMLWVVPQHVL